MFFEQSEYRALVSANPNDTVDPLAAAITQAEVAEIYLNGERLAYIPPSDTRRLPMPFVHFMRQRHKPSWILH